MLLDTGDVTVDDTPLKEAELAYAAAGATSVTLASELGGRLLLLGGEPFGEQIVMWWNFIGRSHDEIAAYRAEWQAQIAPAGEVVADSQQMADGRFGVVIGDHLPPIPAPELPGVRLKPRG